MKVVILIVLICYTGHGNGNTLREISKRESSQDPSLIVGGNPATIEKHPFMVNMVIIFAVLKVLCDGTILSVAFILTAGHCLVQLKGGKLQIIQVSVGSVKGQNGHIYTTQDFHVHTNYNAVGNHIAPDYDVGLVDLSASNLVLSEAALYIPLVTINKQVAVGTQVEVLGWGLGTGNPEPQGGDLISVKLPVMNRTICQNIYKVPITPRMMCIGYLKHSGKGVCIGDSGGPAVLDVATHKVQLGIVSAFKRCGFAGEPAIFTNIRNPEIQKWIRQTAKL